MNDGDKMRIRISWWIIGPLWLIAIAEVIQCVF